MINLTQSRNLELRDENEELAEKIVYLSRENDRNLTKQVTYGAIGIAVGILAMGLITK